MPATPALLRVVEREARVFRRLWRGSVYSSFITPVLFLAAMGVGLGGLIDERNGAVGGLDYLSFVAPGLLAASAMQTAAGESLWPVMAGTKWVRTFHAMVATPVGASDVYGGFVVWTAVRVAMSASAFVLVAALLGGVPSLWGVLAVPAAVLCAAAFAAPLAAFAATQDTDVTSRSSSGSRSCRSSCSPAPSSPRASYLRGCGPRPRCRRSGTGSSCAGRPPPARCTGARRSSTSRR